VVKAMRHLVEFREIIHASGLLFVVGESKLE
jgi:hypothetical protein